MSREEEVNSPSRRERELVLAPNEYAYVLDTTKGHINCYVGPNKTSLAQTDQPVIFDQQSKRFVPIVMQKAIRLFATAPANWYVVLKNPARDGSHPGAGASHAAPDLLVGTKVNLPGPVSFSLWPGQMAEVLAGHALRFNQYLVVRVYDLEGLDSEARAALLGETSDEQEVEVGRSYVIRGTHTRFYIPPTGVEVVPGARGERVRAAVTLGALEYCILEGEDGSREIVRGEAVVFPRANQRFVTEEGDAAHAAIELSATTGLHLKVTAAHTDEEGRAHAAGDELFLTGPEVLYFPRSEHLVIRHDGRVVHQAVAIPEGEGRYVLDRHSGEVELVPGPRMFLPDPRHQVLTRRVLSAAECDRCFPGNAEAARHNAALRAGGEGPARVEHSPGGEAAPPVEPEPIGERSGRFEPPRTLTLDTRYDGAIAIDVWPGFAVQVVEPAGERRVVLGPRRLLLEYGQSLEPLRLSTGVPKDHDATRETVYLKIRENKVSDRVEIVSRDLVRLQVHLVYRSRFEGSADDWFGVENYVKLICDHSRSLLKHRLRQYPVAQLRQQLADLVRDTLLGSKDEAGRPGLRFEDNGLYVHDVEVLDLTVRDEAIRELLDEEQRAAVYSDLSLAERERQLESSRRMEEISRIIEAERARTALRKLEEEATLATARAEFEITRERARQARESERQEFERAQERAGLELAESRFQQVHQQRLESQRLELEAMAARVQGAVEQARAFSPHLVQAVTRLGDEELLASLAKNFGELAAVEGRGLMETARKFLDFAPASLYPVLRPAPVESETAVDES